MVGYNIGALLFSAIMVGSALAGIAKSWRFVHIGDHPGHTLFVTFATATTTPAGLLWPCYMRACVEQRTGWQETATAMVEGEGEGKARAWYAEERRGEAYRLRERRYMLEER